MKLPTINSLMGRMLSLIQRGYLPKDTIRHVRNFPSPKAFFALNPLWKGELYFLTYGCPKVYRREFVFLKSFGPYHGSIIDIGANMGTYSIYAYHELFEKQQGNKIYAFEPMHAVYARLSENIFANHAEQWIKGESIALSDKEGVARFIVDRNYYRDAGQSSLIDVGRPERTINITVPTTTLDIYAKANTISDIGLIKIDVEGNEENVLRGAHEMLAKHKPFILFEVNKEVYDNDFNKAKIAFEKILLPLGYNLFFLDVDKKYTLTEAINRGIIHNGNWWAEPLRPRA